jgi:FkbM family methyltransferase
MTHDKDKMLRWLYEHAPIGRTEIRKAIRTIVGERTVTYRDLSWICRPGDNSVERALWLKGTTDEEEEIDWLLTRLGPHSVFCDIGANCGTYALTARAKAGARVIAIEPNPIMRERLTANMRLNNLTGIEIEPVAIGKDEGTARLNMGSRWDYGQASLVGRSKGKGIDVEVRPLVAVLHKHELARFDAIKIDVEGFEGQALGPFLEMAEDEQLPSALVIEHLHEADWSSDLHVITERRGFHLAGRTANNLLLARS